jgi:hypothetical protein
LGVASLVELALRHHDDVESGRQRTESTKNLTHLALGPVAFDRVPELAGGRHPQAPMLEVVRKGKERESATRCPEPPVVDVPEFRLPCLRRRLRPSYDTDSRFRPFARRRFNTSRPFFVLIRTRNP